MVVNEIVSPMDPMGWHTRDSILSIRSFLVCNGWDLFWHGRGSNTFTDCLAKLALAGNYNYMFSSYNLNSLPKVLSDTYICICENYIIHYLLIMSISLTKENEKKN